MNYNIVARTEEATVIAEYKAEYDAGSGRYQSEQDLERDFIDRLVAQGYERLRIRDAAALVANLRRQLEALNDYTFSDDEWDRFYRERLASANEGIVEKTRKIQTDHVQLLRRDDGTTKNIRLLDKERIHNNRLQVINQYEEESGARPARYDVTVLVNGLPLVHVELKRRGVAIREAFNQIDRYQRDAFWAGDGLFDYVQIFVISNGTHTKYYSNTTRLNHIEERSEGGRRRSRKSSNSFEFTSFWADATNRPIADLVDFTQTFLAKHTLLRVLTRYCVFTAGDMLLVMRPYQIAATERILSRIETSGNYRQTGTVAAGGYIWHTTGSGKTLTSFKTAQLATTMPGVTKVLFVVDRKDLDFQTMQEYDKFQKGAANSSTSTRVLQQQLENPDARIIITTIQKLDRFIGRNRKHDVYDKRIVIIFDECHRSQFGEMHRAIVRAFRRYHLFGFTGTPIFPENAPGGASLPLTTEQIFGERLHTYSIVDAINDGNVLPFRVDYVNTMKRKEGVADKQVRAIDTERAMAAPERIREVVGYLLDHFDQKTKRNSYYTHEGQRLNGFNALFATASIPMAMRYYSEIRRQLAERGRKLSVALIYSFSPNEEDPSGAAGFDVFPDESFDTDALDKTSRDFLDGAIADYNAEFKTHYDTSAAQFENYYKDLSGRMKKREVDLLIVVNMFLTGFDATTLNTLWVDKNLRLHGLLQAFSRTNRILNSVKTYGNIVCFRDLQQQTDEAIALFGDKEAGGVALMKNYSAYYDGYDDEKGQHHPGYTEMIAGLQADFPLGAPIIGEEAEKDFIARFGALLRLTNILTAFDEFEGNEILSPRELQDYRSAYIDLYQKWRGRREGDKERIEDDIVFEMELIRQVEINIDYILMLVARYRDSHMRDTEILVDIRKAVDSSVELRSKKELIEAFIDRVNAETQVDDDWRAFVRAQKEADLAALIAEEGLRPAETRRFIERSLRDGLLKTTGTDIDSVLPPVSRFSGARAARKQSVIDKL
ncbi:MAG: type I restriction endonuclease subunit R, partial [Anaerolineae bacterium]|nr:type I restriction endonuclease subunit R [Anaerolineae bacterium]